MSEQLEMILNLLGANYMGCHNCKFHIPDIPLDSKSSECKTCVPSNWKPDSITAMGKELSTILSNLGDDYPGCHNCMFFNSDRNWQQRGNECKVCIPNNWEPDKTTKIKMDDEIKIKRR